MTTPNTKFTLDPLMLASYDKKIGIITTIVNGMMDGKGKINSFGIAGSPGIGKTFTITQAIAVRAEREVLLNISRIELIDRYQSFVSRGVFTDSSKITEEELDDWIQLCKNVGLNPHQPFSEEDVPEEVINPVRYEFVRGHISPLSVYETLYKNNLQNFFTIFDDSDAVFQNGQSMNLLKAASETSEIRRVTWSSTAASVKEFIFLGKIIILTNADLSKNSHQGALLDRMLMYNPRITQEERINKIFDIAKKNVSLTEEQNNAALEYLFGRTSLEKLTLRTFVKLASVIESYPECWELLADNVIFSEV